MADFTVIMQAKKDLYFRAPGMLAAPFMAKGEITIMQGVKTTKPGYRPILHDETNFRFFIPADQLGLGIKDVR